MRKLTTLFAVGSTVLAACVGNIGGDPPVADTIEATPTSFGCDPNAATVTPSPIRRLAKLYLRHNIEELLSPLDEAARSALLASLQTRIDLVPNDDGDAFSNSDDKISQDHVDAVFGLSIALATKVADDASYASAILGVCGSGLDKSALDDDACLTSFVTYYGRKSFRRPPTQAEVDDFKAFYQQALTTGADGLAALLGRFVAHPNFYYRFDSAGERLAGSEGVDAVYALDRWELLSKVTFLFWASPPDDALYDLVEGSDITQDAELNALLDQVLADPRAERGVLGFFDEWLELDRTLAPGSDASAAAMATLLADAGLAALPTTHRDDMKQELLDLARHYALSTDGRLEDVLTSPYSFARTPELATIYGVQPWDGSDDHLVSLPTGERSGLITRAAMVASNTEYSRPIIKGKSMKKLLLCQVTPPPPPGLDIKPLLHEPDQTTREAVAEVTGDPLCYSCHGTFNDFGFASENYDPLGRLRSEESRFADDGTLVSQLAVDTHALVTLYEGESREVSNAVELSAYLAESGVVHKCMVQNYFVYSRGRAADEAGDGCVMQSLLDELSAEGGSIKRMLRASVMQDAFRQRQIQ